MYEQGTDEVIQRGVFGQKLPEGARRTVVVHEGAEPICGASRVLIEARSRTSVVSQVGPVSGLFRIAP
jgi:hypothetical protein